MSGLAAYASLFRVRLINGLQYRAAAYGGMATQFAWGIMRILMFAAFYKEGAASFPMTFSQLSSYVWLTQSLLALFMLWGLDEEIFAAIREGHVAYELARPVDLYWMWFIKNAAMRLSRVLLRCLPILLFAAVLPAPYGLSTPRDPLSFLLFLTSSALGFGVVVAYCMLIYISAFYTIDPMGVRLMSLSMAEVLSGGIIPLPFLPDGVRRIVELTPFASMQNLPFLIYGGSVSAQEILYGMTLQAFWLFTLVALGRLWMKKALKKAVVQGG